MRVLLLVSVLALVTAPTHLRAASCPEHPATIAAMQDCYRALLLFAPSPYDAHLMSQLDELRVHKAELHERDVMIVVILPGEHAAPGSLTIGLPSASLEPADAQAARREYKVTEDSFAVLLLGKDGGEKMRSTKGLSVTELNRKIDSMPMRQHEAKQPGNR